MQEIVGVVGDVREQALHQPAGPAIYIPLAQRPTDWAYLIVRTTGDPQGLVPALRRAVAALDRNLPLADVRTLEDVVARGLAERRLAMSLFGVFSRAVPGARGPGPLRRHQLHGGAAAAGDRHPDGARRARRAGRALGAGAGAGADRGRRDRRRARRPRGSDGSSRGSSSASAPPIPVTFGGVALLLATTALLASMIPALRAAHLDPASVLRSE